MKHADVVYVVVHSREPAIDKDTPAHAFGPFAGLAELALWESSREGDDACFKFVVPMVVPEDVTVIVMTADDMVVS